MNDILWQAMQTLFDPLSFLCMALAMAYGILLGAIPGLTATMAIAIAIPLTYTLPKSVAIVTFISIYIGGISGGLISAILLRMPGTPASMSTVFDGYPMAQKGLAARALGTGIQASFIGGVFSAVALIIIAPPLANFAVNFGPFEYAALACFALSMASSLSEKDYLKGIMSALLGLFFSCVGQSPIDGTRRFTFGFSDMDGGFEILSVLIGLFAVSELLRTSGNLLENAEKIDARVNFRTFFPPLRETVAKWRSYLRASVIGTFIGILPGIGGGPGGLLAYAQEKRASKTPEQFGTGIPEGVIASEASNNAVTGGALIPMLTLGIPGDATTAIIMGGFIVHDIRPGPLLFQNNPDIITIILIATLFLNFLMLFMETFAIRGFIRILDVPKYRLIPIIIMLCVVGVVGLNNRMFDAWAMLFFGLLGYALERNNFPLAPFVLGFILGPMVEENSRRALLFYNSWIELLERPIGICLLLLALLPFFHWAYRNLKERRSVATGV
ncbi:MAG: tripartite tricarboxylate transporter permease [Desulfovibrionaceae bacterium]|nr:tripartite tricarboxylate transporter permease [Desulfovibrionaceae bacterium]